MKQTRGTPLNESPAKSATASVEVAVQNNDLLWVDEVAALLPDDLRLGWYRNVKPWISTLPPEDEVAHLAYSMGYLALLIRNAPALVAAERVKLAPVLHQLSKEISDALNSTAAYHHKLEERLAKLPAEVADGIHTAEFLATITEEVRNQFSKSGLPEAGRLLKEEGERIQTFASEQAETLRQLRYSMDKSARNANDVLESVQKASCRVRDSIELWNREMRWVQWLHHGLALFIGLVLGCLLYWWGFARVEVVQVKSSLPNQPVQRPAENLRSTPEHPLPNSKSRKLP